MEKVTDNRTKLQSQWREMQSRMAEAGARIGRIKIEGSKSRPTATVHLPYDGRLAEEDNVRGAEETSEEQSIRISRDKKLATLVLRGYGFVRTKQPAFADRVGQAIKIPYVYNPGTK